MSGRLTRALVHALDRVVPRSRDPQHLVTGRRGEEDAYFYLRKLGYVMVARNWRSPRCKGELDLVGWEGDTLCFIEVKTRTNIELMPPEAAVDADKRAELCAVAREFLRVLNRRKQETSTSTTETRSHAETKEKGFLRVSVSPWWKFVSHLPDPDGKTPKYRFDVLSIHYLDPGGKLPQFTLFKNSFPMD